MTRRDSKKHKAHPDPDSVKPSGDTHSGTPNPVDPNKVRSTEHKSGYGGEGGEPRTSSDNRQRDKA